jgi:hypothetical protein
LLGAVTLVASIRDNDGLSAGVQQVEQETAAGA